MKNAKESVVKRDSGGKLLPGHGLVSPGRPIGTISIKDRVRQHLEENPQDVKDIVTHFVRVNRELMWQMLEGKPAQALTNADGGNLVISFDNALNTPPKAD